MARVAIPVMTTSRSGVTEITYTPADAVNHHRFDNASEQALLLVKNGGASPITVTVQTPVTIDGMAVPDLTVTVGAGKDAIIGAFPKGIYNQTYTDGSVDYEDQVLVNMSDATSVSLAVIRKGA